MNILELIKDISKAVDTANIFSMLFCICGIFTLAGWLLKTSLGRNSLVNAPQRRNDMPAYFVVIPLLTWFATAWTLDLIKQMVLADLADWKAAFVDNLILCVSPLPAIAITLIKARESFARGLKGFGLDARTIGRDLPAALLNLLATMPVVFTVIILTTYIGKLFTGGEFQMPRHDELKQIATYSQWQLHALIVFTTVIAVPAIEELFFRGLLQTVLRSVMGRPWPAIFLTSLVFMVFHANPEHWPALFATSICFGYSYEKSGSLFRPFFVHSLFNAMSVFGTLSQ